jgi:hypothetical protein
VNTATRRDAIDTREAVGVAGMATTGDEQEVGLGAPAIARADAHGFGGVLQQLDPPIGSVVGDALDGVVAMVRGGALVDPAVRADADLDPLPIVDVKTGI